MEDETVRRAVLFDLYGALLTGKQREYYDLHYNEDLSLGEIAEQAGISRQGVWDMIRRADKTLAETEEKLQLAARFSALRAELDEIQRLLASGETGDAQKRLAALEI